MRASLRRVVRRPLLLLATLVLLFLPGSHALRAISLVQARALHANGAPSPSGALMPYPLNHDLATNVQPLGTSPSNNGFESPAVPVGTPPTNFDFSVSGPSSVGTPPTNNSFSTGDYTGWTTSGSPAPTIASDSHQTDYAYLPAGTSIVSSPFTVDPSAQVVAFALGEIATNDYTRIEVQVLYGSNYSQKAWITRWLCYKCGTWIPASFDISSWRGQSVELEFDSIWGYGGVDDVIQAVTLADYSTTGTVTVQSGGPTGHYAAVQNSGSLTSTAFTLDPAEQSLTFAMQPDNASQTVQTHAYLHTGSGYTTKVDLGYLSIQGGGAGGWQTQTLYVAGYGGQSVELELDNTVTSTVDLTNIASQGYQETPDWTTGMGATEVTGGVSGQALHLPGNVSATSQPFTIAAGEQQVTVTAYKGDTAGASFDAYLLSGPTYATVTSLGHVNEDPSTWNTL